MAYLPHDAAETALSSLLSAFSAPEYESNASERLIDQLAREADKLEGVISAFRDDVQKHKISPMRRQHNILLPIYRLSNEIILEIFLKVSENAVGAARYHAHLTLASVSSHWRLTACSSARLWDDLTTELGPKTIEVMLKRSKQAPLTLRFSNYNGARLRRFLELIMPNMARWRALYSSSRESSQIVMVCLAGRYLPSLESLTLIKSASREPIRSSLSIIAPSLKKLDTGDFPFPLHLGPDFHSNLTSAVFTAYKDGAAFLAEHYHTLLSSSPYLEDIIIYGYSSPGYHDPRFGTPVDIPLMNLKTLKLYYLPYETIGYLITSISTAPGRYPHVSIYGESSGLVSSILPQPSTPNNLVEAISGSQWARFTSLYSDDNELIFVEISAGMEEMGVRMPVFDTMLKCNGLPPLENLSVLLEGGCFSQLRDMEIDGPAFFSAGQSVLKLHLLPYLENLRIRCGDEEAVGLGISIGALASSSPVVCPQLRYLAFDTFNESIIDLDTLTRLLAARTSETGTPSEVQCCFQILELSGPPVNDPSYEQLQQYASQRNVDLVIDDSPEW